MITDNNTRVSSHGSDTRQEIRLVHTGGGPMGMEVIFETTERGVEVKVFNPFKHEWTTINPDALMNHGDTRT